MTNLLAAMLLCQVTTPAEAVILARNDLAQFPIERRSDYLYMSLYNVPPEDRAKLIAVLNGHCNQLSTLVDREPVTVLGNDASMVRVNGRDYGWSRSTVTKLNDPRFTTIVEEVRETFVEVPWRGGVWPGDGKTYAAGTFTVKTPKREVIRKTTGTGPWLSEGPEQTKAVVDLLLWGDQFFPLCSATWFLNQTAIQEGRSPGYYDMLGITNLKSFEKAVRFNEELASQLEQRKAVVFSGITLQPRLIEATKSVMGNLWRTRDSEKATDEKNPLRVLDTKTFRFDATEQIAPLPNGLPAFLLANAKGELQGKAPDNIVGGDKTGHGNDTRLHVNLSCIRCHNQNKGENFIKDVDWVKIARLKSYDYDTLRELKRQYLRDIEPEIEASRQLFGKAIIATTGMQAQEYAFQLQRFFSGVEDARVDAAYAARDMGYAPEELVRRLRAYDAAHDLDPVLSIIMNGGAVPIRQWEESIHLAHAAVRSVK